ncbi:MAG: type III-A CRISPR-associated RAMP protein Csm4 [Thermoplasmata archaeon]
MIQIAFKISFIRQYTVIDSIKLSGAILNSMLTLYPAQKDEIIDNFVNGNIRVTTPYPFKNVPYFPMPPLSIIFPANLSIDEKKNYMKKRKKKIKYIQLNDLKNCIRSYQNNNYKNIYINDLPSLNEDESLTSDNYLIEEPGVKILKTPKKREEKWIFTEVYTKEFASSGKIYYSAKDKLIYGDEKWFLTQIKNDKFKEMFLTALNFLEDMGLSGRRTTGKGKFTIKKLNLDQDFEMGFKGEGLYILLSEFIPSIEDLDNIDLDKSSYSLEIFSGIDKNGSSLGVYRYFKSGSIVYLRNEIKGMSIYIPEKRIIPFSASYLRVSE